jgi:hypothetical protein
MNQMPKTGLKDKRMEQIYMSLTDLEKLSAAQGITAESHNGADSTLKNLAKALVKAQSEMKNASLNKVNPHFRSKYADLAEIRDTVMPVLSKHGLAVVQFTQVTGTGFYLVTRLLHDSGEYLDSRFPLPEDVTKPQAMGSSITYARRYMLAAMCGITAEEDDDGNAAQANPNGGGQKARAAGGARGGNLGGGNVPNVPEANGIVL